MAHRPPFCPNPDCPNHCDPDSREGRAGGLARQYVSASAQLLPAARLREGPVIDAFDELDRRSPSAVFDSFSAVLYPVELLRAVNRAIRRGEEEVNLEQLLETLELESAYIDCPQYLPASAPA
jgi:hypothetical protein